MPAVPEQKDITRHVVAASIGNAMEWYDIAVYGYFAVYVSKAFFPNNDPTASLLLTFGTFGLSFLVRPIGGVVLGAYARPSRPQGFANDIHRHDDARYAFDHIDADIRDYRHPCADSRSCRPAGAGIFGRRRI
jgi:MFS family permease